ncbi:MAG TPA: hypothetical protein VKA50_07985 [Gammaproteobacteria bacterium]|nr:hypothetical protein [Gammaproteobacteria bacterium]
MQRPKFFLSLVVLFSVSLSGCGGAGADMGTSGHGSMADSSSAGSGGSSGGTVTVVSPGGGPVDVSQLPINEWVAVTPGVELAPGVATDTTLTGNARNYGNTTYRPMSGEIVYYEGIQDSNHDIDYYADAIAGWDIDQNRILIRKVTNWGGSLYSGGYLLNNFSDDPTPSPRHVYDAFTYVPNRDLIALILGANSKMVSSSSSQAARDALNTDNKSTWLYHFSDSSWDRRIDNNIRQFWPSQYDVSPYESHLHYWPGHDKLIFLDSYGTHGAQYDLATRKWTETTPVNSPPGNVAAGNLYNALSTWDRKRDRWVFRSDNSNLFFYDPATRKYSDLPDPPGLSGSGDITYMSDVDKYLVVGLNGSETWIFDPTTNQWSQIDGGAADFSGGHERYVEYDDTTGVVGMVPAVLGGRFYLFRYAQ